jgi:hypothetical protein
MTAERDELGRYTEPTGSQTLAAALVESMEKVARERGWISEPVDQPPSPGELFARWLQINTTQPEGDPS